MEEQIAREELAKLNSEAISTNEVVKKLSPKVEIQEENKKDNKKSNTAFYLWGLVICIILWALLYYYLMSF